jgi:hypothetical protein
MGVDGVELGEIELPECPGQAPVGGPAPEATLGHANGHRAHGVARIRRLRVQRVSHGVMASRH